MRRLTLFLVALCLAVPALAERKQSFGALDVHYSAFNSSFLQPDVAAAAGLVRSKQQGVLNVALVEAGKPAAGEVRGEVKDLLGKRTALTFRQVREGESIYYLAQFPIESREMLAFSLKVKAAGGAEQSLDFSQEIFPDE
ncbi:MULTISPECIES: DUF4426 domain-containing protein [Pseudomonas]|uniref:DUF4426 domain-containing protein n=1 Tax=Pseudomonas kuykendallii TaxID=1007099 RepID=A0A2W5EPT1_9PSED|nr:MULTISPECIES: DUF4426 domain-containing protein [Pseudomonas]PZP22066.1 MAG: DUF4426 domain-containing protein [Pseudomonas kuykendallii]